MGDRVRRIGLDGAADLDQPGAAAHQEVAAQEIAVGLHHQVAASIIGGHGIDQVALGIAGAGASADHQGFRQGGADIDDISAGPERDVAAAESAEALEEGVEIHPGRGLACLAAGGRTVGERSRFAVRQPVVNVPAAPELTGRTIRDAIQATVGIVDRRLDADDGASGRDGHRAAAARPARHALEAIRSLEIV